MAEKQVHYNVQVLYSIAQDIICTGRHVHLK